MHAATVCIPVFLIPMAASILPQVTNWCIISGLPKWYTINFLQPQTKMSNGLKVGHWVGQATSPLPHIHLPPQLLSKNSFTSLLNCGAAPSCCSHIELCVEERTSFKQKGNSASRQEQQHRAVEHPSITCGPMWLVPNNTSHNTSTEKECWKWYCAT